MMYILGLLYLPWFTVTYLLVNTLERVSGSLLYEWPDGSRKPYPWSPDSNPKGLDLLEAKSKRRWGDEYVDMSKIRQINRYL